MIKGKSIMGVRRLAGCFLVAAGLALPAAAVAQDLLIGYLMASTGPFVSLSRSNEVAADMAVERINAAGGVNGKPIKLIKFDTAGKPEQAVVGLRKLAEDDKVLAIMGPFSTGEARVAFPAGDRLGVVSMPMASSAPKLAEPFKYAFRNTTNEAIMFGAVLRILKEKAMPMASAAIAYGTDDAISAAMGTQVMPAVFKANGVDLKKTVDFKLAAFDMSPQVSQLMETPTDLVGVGAPPEAAIRLAKEMRRQGHKGRLVAGSTIMDPDLPGRMGAEGDGTVVPTTFYAELNERTKTFADEFAKRAKAKGLERIKPGQFDAATYGIAEIYAYAMRTAKVTGDPSKLAAERNAIRDALRGMKDFPSLEGAISFGADGDALKPIYVVEIKAGGWQLLGTQPK